MRTNLFELNQHNLNLYLAPRAASTSIKRTILESVNQWDEHPHRNPYLRDREVLGETALNLWYPVVAVVRHPIDRLKSVYRHLVCDQYWKSFERYGITPGILWDEFIQRVISVDPDDTDIHLRPMSFLFDQWQIDINLLIKYEQLTKQWEAVRRISGVNLPRLEHENASCVQVEASDENNDLIRQYYAKDFELFDYT